MEAIRRVLLRIAVLALAVVVLAPAAPVAAHYIHTTPIVTWEDGRGRCIKNRAEVSHGENGNGYFKGGVGAFKIWRRWTPWGDVVINCQAFWKHRPGFIAVKVRGLVKTSTGAWAVCKPTATKWHFNDAHHWGWTVWKAGFTKAPCGARTYWSESGGYVWHNGAWRGGWVGTTEGHSLPAS